jgi:light-regulated signal transduction histidine kinase (bacteriophytochrome)
LAQFARLAAHDLQEPLRQVINYTQLLSRRYLGRLDADADEFIGYAIEGAKRMQRLVLDLLAYTEIGLQKPVFTEVEGETALAGALADLRGTIADRGATVTHDPLPCVWGDSGQLRVLFRNLISNGLKFHGQSPPHIHIVAVRRDAEWIFSVQDNGIGIEPQYLRRLFLVFQRLHHQEPYPKPGVGLAICRKIVEQHGRRIWVDSEPGKGATFFFTLSVIPPALDGANNRRKSPRSSE